MPAEDQFTRLPFGRNVVRFGDEIGIDCDDGLLRVLMPDAAHRILPPRATARRTASSPP